MHLTDALERRYGDLRREYPLKIPGRPEYKELRREIKIQSTMYDWHLAGKTDTFGALGIAKAVLFL